MADAKPSFEALLAEIEISGKQELADLQSELAKIIDRYEKIRTLILESAPGRRDDCMGHMGGGRFGPFGQRPSTLGAYHQWSSFRSSVQLVSNWSLVIRVPW